MRQACAGQRQPASRRGGGNGQSRGRFRVAMSITTPQGPITQMGQNAAALPPVIQLPSQITVQSNDTVAQAVHPPRRSRPRLATSDPGGVGDCTGSGGGAIGAIREPGADVAEPPGRSAVRAARSPKVRAWAARSSRCWNSSSSRRPSVKACCRRSIVRSRSASPARISASSTMHGTVLPRPTLTPPSRCPMVAAAPRGHLCSSDGRSEPAGRSCRRSDSTSVGEEWLRW